MECGQVAQEWQELVASHPIQGVGIQVTSYIVRATTVRRERLTLGIRV